MHFYFGATILVNKDVYITSVDEYNELTTLDQATRMIDASGVVVTHY